MAKLPATSGGRATLVTPSSYKPPVGPKGPSSAPPSTNHGNCGTQQKG